VPDDGIRTIRQQVDNPLHLLFETNFQDTICLIDDKTLEIAEDKILRVLAEVM
jgi:hypothetical protein